MEFPQSPVHIMEVRLDNGEKKIYNHYDVIDKILLHSEVKNRKIVTLSIVGEFRKGKSFLLDYCLRFMYANFSSLSKPLHCPYDDWLGDPSEPLTGFSWKHGCNSTTKGILFWSDVFLYDSPLGEKIAIIIMDTQGLFEPHSTQDENARIFGLSTLLSSMQILNYKGEIQEDKIEYLETATNLTKFISKFKKSEWKPFQRLLFLIRDWTDEDTGYGYSGGSDYLKEILKPGHTETKANLIRVNIHESFDSIECFLLNPPGSEVTKKDFGGEHGRLDVGFVANLKTLIESLLKPENLNKKSILGKDVTGWEFRNVIYAYLEAFKNTKLPNIENIFQMTIDNQMMAIVTEQVQEYQKSMNENLYFNQEDFEGFIDSKHESQKGAAIARFSKVDKFEDDKRNLKFKKMLEEEIEDRFNTWRATTMNSYQQSVKLNEKINELKCENHQFQENVKKIQDEIKNKAIERLKLQQKYEEEFKRQQQQVDGLISQIERLSLSFREKEAKIEDNINELYKMCFKHDQSMKVREKKLLLMAKKAEKYFVNEAGNIQRREKKLKIIDGKGELKSRVVDKKSDYDRLNSDQERVLSPLESIKILVEEAAYLIPFMRLIKDIKDEE